MVEAGEAERGESVNGIETVRTTWVGQLIRAWEYAGDQFSQKATQTPETTMKRRRASSVVTGRCSLAESINDCMSMLDGVATGVGKAELGVGGEVAIGTT